MSHTALLRLDPAAPVLTSSGTGLGTVWRVRHVARPPVSPASVRHAVEAKLAAITGEMSQWVPDSVLSRFNRAPAGTWFALPPDFATVIAAALDLARRSGGAFDPTFGRTAALLGFGAEPTTTALSAAQLDDARAAAGWERLAFERGLRRLRQPGGLWLDLSGIAKGFAVDAVADLLVGGGLEDVLVEIGGELAGRGLKPNGAPWWVDLETAPDAPAPPLRLGLHDLAVATSGDYVRGAHTIDPATGRPLAPRTASVSVVHASAMLADAWATALTVLSADNAYRLASTESLAARIVRRSDTGATETLTPALAAMIDDEANESPVGPR